MTTKTDNKRYIDEACQDIYSHCEDPAYLPDLLTIILYCKVMPLGMAKLLEENTVNLSQFADIKLAVQQQYPEIAPHNDAQLSRCDEGHFRTLMKSFRTLLYTYEDLTWHKRLIYATDTLLNYYNKAYANHQTPTNISHLAAQILQPQDNDSIYDPVCGMSGMLLACADKAQSTTIFSHEVDSNIYETTRLVQYIYDGKPAALENADCLASPFVQDDQLQQFDIVLGSPPWGQKIDNKTFFEQDEFQRFKWGKPSVRLDYAYLSHMIACMNPNTGRMAVLMPLGVLFRGANEAVVRQQWLEHNILDAVIVLPEKLLPHTPIAMVLLIFRQQKMDNSVLFIDASHDYQPDKFQNQLRPEDLTRIVHTYQTRSTQDHYSHLVSLEEIQKREYKLNISFYVDTKDDIPQVNMQALDAEREQLLQQWSALQHRLNTTLADG